MKEWLDENKMGYWNVNEMKRSEAGRLQVMKDTSLRVCTWSAFTWLFGLDVDTYFAIY